jgi:hypothetical protein
MSNNGTVEQTVAPLPSEFSEVDWFRWLCSKLKLAVLEERALRIQTEASLCQIVTQQEQGALVALERQLQKDYSLGDSCPSAGHRRVSRR